MQGNEKITKIVNFKARNLIFCMKVVLDNPQPERGKTGIREVKLSSREVQGSGKITKIAINFKARNMIFGTFLIESFIL